ncbi:MAG: cation diffusion facilitator family transporter [Halobacteriaceae archaeon]
MASSTAVVVAALFANGVIAVLKFIGYLLTGSPSMLSETYHSISDTGNQLFLLLGIRYGRRDTSRAHPFGYGKAQFFYSFLVAVLLFGIAGWESVSHGYHALTNPHQPAAGTATLPVVDVTFPAVYVNYAVLLAAIGFEGYAFSKAYANMARQIESRGWSGFREAFRKTSDVTVLTALTEDTIAIAGAGIALVGVFLSRYTGNPVYDAVGALVIGVMLMGFALALAWENKRLILGESLPSEDENRLRAIVTGFDEVLDIVDFRSVYFGPDRVVITADVAFVDDLDTTTIDDCITDIEDALIEANGAIEKVYIEPE